MKKTQGPLISSTLWSKKWNFYISDIHLPFSDWYFEFKSD